MTYLKAGAWLALAFMAGGGASAYWFGPSHADQSELSPPDDLTEVADTKTDSALQRQPRSQEAEPASEISLHGSSPSDRSADDQSAEPEPYGDSAADILWALEQAYQNQEKRIRLLEMALNDQQTHSDETHSDDTQVDETQAEAESVVAAVSQATSETYVAPAKGPGWGAPSDFPSQQELALPREQTPRVVSVDEPIEDAAWEENQRVLLAQQQMVIVNHYFLSHPTPIGTSSQLPGLPRSSAMRALEQRRSETRQDLNVRSSTTGSWVASGFDVYSR